MTNSDYFREHASLSEWLRRGNASRAAQLAAEDLTKTDRLRELHELIGLPSVPTQHFTAHAVLNDEPPFNDFRIKVGLAPCALRLRKLDGSGTLARNRGLTPDELTRWSQTVAAPDVIQECTFEFERHVDADLALIVLHNEQGIAVEIADGPLRDLSRGTHGTYVTEGDINKVIADSPSARVRNALTQVLAYLNVEEDMAKTLTGRGYPNHNGTLVGYFEAIVSDGTLYFVDYNVPLAELDIAVVPQTRASRSDVPLAEGRVGSPGIATGRARLVDIAGIEFTEFRPGDVLVCEFTAPDLAHLMGVAAAVVTEVGGVLSHAAVMCRELGIPSIVGAARAMSTIPEGSPVVVDASTGQVHLA